MAATDRLSLREKIAYGAGDLGFNFYWTTISAFGLIFFTDVFGLDPLAAGTMLLISRVLDAFADPIMGAVADRTRSRLGRFRPWIFGAAAPMAVLGVLCFFTPPFDHDGKLVYAYLTYNLLMIVYSIANIPYSALSGVMSADGQDRTTLNSFRFVGGFLGGTIVTYATPLLVKSFGGANPAQGWPIVMAIYGVAVVAIMALVVLNTRERISPPPQQASSPWRDIRDLFGNKPWLVLFALALVIMVTITLRMATSAYYMRYVVGREDLIGPFLTSYGVALAAGALLTPMMTKWIDKPRLMMILMGAVAVLSASFFVIPPDQIGLMFVVQVLIGLCLGPKSPLAYAMYADAADYTEYRFGRRATAMTYAAATFSQKLGGALASYLIGAGLKAVDYVANGAQTVETKGIITVLMSLAPAAAALISVAVLLLYKLDKASMSAVSAELARRRAALEE